MWTVIAVILIGVIGLFHFAFNRPTFDPNKVAHAERKMWEAYYAHDQSTLALSLISLLRQQYGLTLNEAKRVGEHLANAALKFHSIRSNYENEVSPDLIEAYRLIKEAKKYSFDYEEVARLELAWWVARRTPGQDSTESVGELISELYVTLYGVDHPEFHKAGMLRAQAAALRDNGMNSAEDWNEVEHLLQQSYRDIKEGLSKPFKKIILKNEVGTQN